MNVAIVGAGAMGCLFGAFLKTTAVNLILVDVWREHIDAIQGNGLLVQRDQSSARVSIAACLPADLHMKPDLVILFTKCYHTDSALNAIRNRIHAGCHLLTLQNGVGHHDLIRKYFSPGRIIHGITTYPSDIVGPGHIRTRGDGYIRFMSLDGEHNPMLARIEDLLGKAGLKAQIDPQVSVWIWEKLAFNAAMNALTALLGITVGQLADSPDGRELVFQIVDETVAVAKKMHLAVDRQRIVATISMAFREHRAHKPSMLQDVLQKKRTEIDFINGAIVKHAQSLGLTAPINAALYRLIKIVESNYRF